jgi:hypothetical protein
MGRGGIKMKLVEYNVFGDEREYCDITFEDYLQRKVVVSIKQDGKHTLECDGVSLDDVLQVIEMIKSGKLEIEV